MTIPEQAVQAAEAVRKFICDEIEAMANFSCGCDPRYCSCHRAREVYNLAAEHVAGLDLSPITAAAPHLAAVRVNSDKIEAAHKAVEELAHVQMNLPLEDWSRISSAILSALEPSAGRAAVLEEAARVAEERAKHTTGCNPYYVAIGIAEAIRALHPVADKPDEAGAQGEGWLPIESAPKDGKIDIWATDNDGKGRRVTDCYYDRICDEWRTSAPALRLHCVKARYVTHWRPLPTPPSGEVA